MPQSAKKSSNKSASEKRKFRDPTDEEKKLIYEIYKLLCGSHFSHAKKRALMTAALGYETWSWRVTGISENAIRAIAMNDFKKPSRMLSRDHSRPRAETYNKEFFESIKPFEEWWSWVWDNDKTTLMTNEEHHNREQRSKIYPLDPKENYFVDTEVAGWHQTKKHEGAMIRRLIEEKNIKI